MFVQKEYKFPPIIEETLSNGLSIMLVENHEQQGLTLGLQLPFGEFCDPAGLEGLTEITIATLLKGPKKYTPEEFSERFEHIGAALFSESGDEHCVIGCKMLSRYASDVIPLFWEMIVDSEFRQKELVRLKREMITGLQAETADPMSIANWHFTSLICGPSHPAGRVHTTKSIKRITLQHVLDHYKSLFCPNGCVLVITGDFNSIPFLETFKPVFSSWNSVRSKQVVIGEPLNPITENKIRLLDKPDLSQVSFILGHTIAGELGSSRNELALANYIIGGGNFSSRLMAHIRSKEGKTYGISSQISCNRNFGVFSIATSTQNSQVESMLEAIMTVYKKASVEGVTEDELAKAKQFAIGNMAFQLEGIVNIADKLLWLRQFGRTISYIEHFNEMISSITLNSVNQAISSYLSSSGFAVIAVGKKAEAFGTLSKYGTVEVMNFRSNPF